MTFLPIVARELRVASRKRSTFWVRVAAALVALVIGSGFLIMSMVGVGFGTASLGKGLFGTLTWLSLGAALSAGLFFTSDCLSEEKREGTIGFLFLTDLSGYDVVLGKLIATSLRGFYALLAVFPILAVTMLMGGVTGAQFWKTALALLNAMFLSLASGLFVSAISRDSQKALTATLLLVVFLVAGGPVGDAISAGIQKRSYNPVLSLSSPGYLFVTAGAWSKIPFWPGLLVNQAVAWLLFGLTGLLLPRTWQEKTAKLSAVKGSWSHWWKFGGAKRQEALRRKLVALNPVLWLACRERWQAGSLWILSLLTAGGVAASFAGTDQSGAWIVWGYLGGVVTLAFYLGITSQACRFFVEAQRRGFVELLLGTPLTVKQIVQGHWRALLRMFGPPLTLYLATQLLSAVMFQQYWSRLAGVTAPPAITTVPTVTNSTVVIATNPPVVTVTPTPTVTGASPSMFSAGNAAPIRFMTLVISVAATLTTAADLAALAWFGMWAGLTSKNANLATLKTIVFVQIIPWFVVITAASMVVPLLLLPRFMKGLSSAPSQMIVWYPLMTSGVATVLYLAKDLGFLVWTRRKLYSEFRERAGRGVATIRPARLPPLTPAATPPTSAPT